MADLAAAEVQSAVAALHPPLPEGSVLPVLPDDSPRITSKCNTSKSHFAYFHDTAAPLLQSQRQTLANHSVQ